MTETQSLPRGEGRLRAGVMRLARFALVGVAGTLVYLGVALGAVALHVDVRIAHWIAFAVSQVVSYVGQKIFTFGVRGQHRRTGARFLVAMAGLATGQFLLVLGLNAMHVDPRLTVIASTAYYPFASLIVHSLWTFRTEKPRSAQEDAP